MGNISSDKLETIANKHAQSADNQKVQSKHLLSLSNAKRKEFIIFGFIREFERCHKLMIRQVIPISIIKIIKSYYAHIYDFAWRQDIHGKNLLFPNKKTVKYQYDTSISFPAICVSNQIISSDQCKWFEWEIQLIDWKWNSNVSAVNFGFVKAPISATIYNNWEGHLGSNRYGQYAINASATGSYFSLIGGDKKKMHSGTTVRLAQDVGIVYAFSRKPRIGDFFKVRIDFEEKNIRLFHNSHFINTVYNDIDVSDGIIAAASLYNAEITVTDTDYNY